VINGEAKQKANNQKSKKLESTKCIYIEFETEEFE
jgi:hypothetical protein